MVTTNSDSVAGIKETARRFSEAVPTFEGSGALGEEVRQKEIVVLREVLTLVRPMLKYIATEQCTMSTSPLRSIRICRIIKNKPRVKDLLILGDGSFYSYDVTARESYASVPVEFVTDWWGLENVVEGIKNAFEYYLCQQRERAENAQRRINGCNRVLEVLNMKEDPQCEEESPPLPEEGRLTPKRFSWGWWVKLLG